MKSGERRPVSLTAPSSEAMWSCVLSRGRSGSARMDGGEIDSAMSAGSNSEETVLYF